MTKETKKVCINIKSIQTADGDSDSTDLFTYGELSPMENNAGYTVIYEENGTTGYEGSTVTLEITKQWVRMIRTGTALSDLMIEKDKKHHCHYGTPYGDIMVGISANHIKTDVTENGGSVYLKYTIDINSSFMSENEMYINIKECNNEQHN